MTHLFCLWKIGSRTFTEKLFTLKIARFVKHKLGDLNSKISSTRCHVLSVSCNRHQTHCLCCHCSYCCFLLQLNTSITFNTFTSKHPQFNIPVFHYSHFIKAFCLPFIAKIITSPVAPPAE